MYLGDQASELVRTNLVMPHVAADDVYNLIELYP
jgi:hypothetical protein